MIGENAAAAPLASQRGYETNAGITLATPAATAAWNGATSSRWTSSPSASTMGRPSCESVVVRPCPG